MPSNLLLYLLLIITARHHSSKHRNLSLNRQTNNTRTRLRSELPTTHTHNPFSRKGIIHPLGMAIWSFLFAVEKEKSRRKRQTKRVKTKEGGGGL